MIFACSESKKKLLELPKDWSGKEAPEWAKLSAAGQLPPLEERIPADPLVMKCGDSTGQYGGKLRRLYIGSKWAIAKLMEEFLVRYNIDGTDFVPGLARSWDVSPDNRIYTFYLRKGLKWSDGHPFTTEDLYFAIVEEALNPEFMLYGALSTAWDYERNIQKVEMVDDHTLRITLAKPNSLFLHFVASQTYRWAERPKHYLRQFHPNYVDKIKLDSIAYAQGMEGWRAYYNMQTKWHLNSAIPTMCAWVCKIPPPATRVVFHRNPYCYRVDEAGKQLPYLDEITFDLIQTPEVYQIKAMNGEADMLCRDLDFLNYPLYKKLEKEKGYRLLPWRRAEGASELLQVNITHSDPEKRRILNDKRFRWALSLAINRDEYNMILKNGLGKPRQASLLPISIGYDPEWESAFAEYDPQQANAYLDQMGLTQRDEDGFRLRFDGKMLEVVVLRGATGPSTDIELLEDYWANIGIRLSLAYGNRIYVEKRRESCDFDIFVWHMDRMTGWFGNPLWIIGGDWAQKAQDWIETNGERGEKPEGDESLEEFARLRRLWMKVQTARNIEKRNVYVQQIIDIHKEQLYMIGTVGDLPAVAVCKNGLMNVPQNVYFDDPLRTPGNALPWIWWWADEKRRLK